MNHTKELCGCTCSISQVGDAYEVKIIFCPLHKAAPDLEKALKAVTNRLTHTTECNSHSFDGMSPLAKKTMEDCDYDNKCDCQLDRVCKKVREALAKVEG